MAAAPLPPQLAAQQSPEGAQSAFAQQGLPKPQPGMQAVQMAMQKVQELDKWAGDMAGILQQLDPSKMPLLAPIANAGKDLIRMLQEMAQRSGMAQGSPVTAGQPPMN